MSKAEHLFYWVQIDAEHIAAYGCINCTYCAFDKDEKEYHCTTKLATFDAKDGVCDSFYFKREDGKPSLLVNCHRHKYDVYIGRPSKWGNPFVVGVDGTREHVIEMYEDWILEQPDLMADLHELRGKVLGCHCYPRRCHGEVLVKLANENRGGR